MDDRLANWRGSDLHDTNLSRGRPLASRELNDLLERAATVDLDRPDTIRDATAAPGPARERAMATRQALLTGHGFAMVTELPVADLDTRTSAAAFVVFGSMIGPLRPQNAAGHRLGHVRNVGAVSGDPNVRIYQTNERQSFHTDSSDAVGLLCLKTAQSGGESMIVSVEAVFDEMERRVPGQAHRLFEPIETDRRGEESPGELGWFTIPVLNRYEGFLTPIYQRQYIESARRFSELPPLDVEYIEALDLFDEVMNDPEIHLRIGFEPGDMQFVHNHSLLHDRMGFVDHPEPERRRHLLRLWLTLDGDRPLPESFRDRYGSITTGDRGGVMAGLAAEEYPIDG